MKNQKIRSMKVHEQSGYNYKATDGGKALETRTDFGDGGGSAYYYCWNNR